MIFCELLRVYNHNASVRGVSESRLHTGADRRYAFTWQQRTVTGPSAFDLCDTICFHRFSVGRVRLRGD